MLMMENAEVEENLLSIGEPKLHGGMCKSLSAIYAKVLGIFPELEAARPRSTSGIQALCALHIALEKTKNILQHCAECSKLYLAITGDSIVLKFERARCALEDSLKRVEDIVPQSIGGQISEVLNELEGIEFSLDPLEKQVGDDIITLLQQGRKFNGNDNNELESFHQAASRLGITSSRAALRERRALKKLVERARAEEDKRKESIVAYLLHLIRKYSKLFRSEFSDDNDSQGSTPCSPTVQGSFEDGIGPGGNIIHAFDRQFSKLSSFNFKPNFRRSDQMPVPPEELRCPISLQLMYDPVIIASGQTYERICIEKWFSDGHNTCPKTQQELPHLGLTPNYCVKGLVASWCEQNGLPIPDGPPESLDLNYWRLALSESESTNSKSTGSIASCKFKGVKVVPLEDSGIIEEAEGNEVDEPVQEDELQVNSFERYEDFLAILNKEDDFRKKCRVVEQIRHLLKDDEEIRIYMGANGFIEALLGFLECAVQTRNEIAQEIGTMALFNLGVNNNRNKELMLAAGVLPLLGRMVATSSATIAATALYLNLSCLEEAKPVIGSCEAVPFLIGVLQHETDTQCKLDALHALFNLSTNQTNIPHLLSAGILDGLKTLMSYTDDHTTEKCIAVLINLSLSKSAKEEIMSSPGLISRLATVLDIGEPLEQEQAAACLLILCNGNEKCSQMVLQEGVIPSLVSISVNGTMRGKQKAQKLLMLFREQRQREPSLVQTQPRIEKSETLAVPPEDSKPLCKSTSRKKLGKAWSFLWKNKSFSVYQC
ncbi:U-box domain-containing protein 6-like isoform X1 [Nicotiana tabacum]|uniref:RING-type E3 ubiquitin transferase n=2 Tax=Nicotiana TaxID=4085 RepID=A0A1S4A959_TOBAC|nr:PREDICTED: U-box domain-containing protein 45-like [Nicotiana sylvestris]XP_009761878.1 PREDICTED: U-box domain-containing protein 45-like [Nicotiana sylvestris]XP_016473181.1 PREDICTED: U-box domain-containing protein 45-like isoform X1 [Nicotiana tabacum]XP_016473182.1 PREDICTED: U-box domain-containing protein 45-like isoform X1 [Nicotiana tabacum]